MWNLIRSCWALTDSALVYFVQLHGKLGNNIRLFPHSLHFVRIQILSTSLKCWKPGINAERIHKHDPLTIMPVPEHISSLPSLRSIWWFHKQNRYKWWILFSTVATVVASVPQFIFALYNHNNTTLADFLLSLHHTFQPLVLVFRTNFNTEEVSLRSAWWCHKPTGMLGITFDPR